MLLIETRSAIVFPVVEFWVGLDIPADVEEQASDVSIRGLLHVKYRFTTPKPGSEAVAA
jgi:hypothetical protein